MMYLGFDIGKRHHDAALLDADGTVVRQLRFAATRAGLTQLATWLEDLAVAELQIGLEATGSTGSRCMRGCSSGVRPRAAPP
jgi:predicted NBD/HSP70 family sugar kinase